MFCSRAVLLAAAALTGAAPVPSPSPPAASATAAPDPEGERLFLQTRRAWALDAEVPFLRYGALVRYLHGGNHVVDTWWDASYRSADGVLVLERIHDAEAENRRLKGFPFSIFGVKIFDTNADAEPIRVDAPRLPPTSNFGISGRAPARAATPAPGTSPTPLPSPGDLREIGHVEANARNYAIAYVGDDVVGGTSARHIRLTPVRDPEINRLRDVWIDAATNRTLRLDVQGILNGKPYDGIRWTVRYVTLEGRSYVQQIVADEPLHFGLDTTIPKFEIDFVDYQFPASIPRQVFETTLFEHVRQ